VLPAESTASSDEHERLRAERAARSEAMMVLSQTGMWELHTSGARVSARGRRSIAQSEPITKPSGVTSGAPA
jgi:hypothetical protein